MIAELANDNAGHRMDQHPQTFIALADWSKTQNVSLTRFDSDYYVGQDVTTIYQRVRIDPATLIIEMHCAEIKTAQPDAADGEYTLFLSLDPPQPTSIYCHNM